jgi:cytochrome c553
MHRCRRGVPQADPRPRCEVSVRALEPVRTLRRRMGLGYNEGAHGRMRVDVVGPRFACVHFRTEPSPMNRLRLFAVVPALFLFLPVVALRAAPATQAAPAALSGAQLVAHVCSACHGPHGDSLSSAFPKLAGQGDAYILLSLHQFKDGAWKNAIMQSMVATLTPSEMKAVAAYLSRQKMTHGFAQKRYVALGRRIFEGGLPKQHVPACMACHGVNGRGNEPAAYPRLAGQWSAYVVRQLVAFAHDKRPSPHGIMNYIAKRLTPQQMKAVASYVQGLR